MTSFVQMYIRPSQVDSLDKGFHTSVSIWITWRSVKAQTAVPHLEGNSVALFSFLSLLSLGSQGKGNHRCARRGEKFKSQLSSQWSKKENPLDWKVWVNNRKKRELNDAVCELQESPPGCTSKYLTLNNTLKILTIDLWGTPLPKLETSHWLVCTWNRYK